MAYFSPAKQTEVPVDASPAGVGVILVQEGKIVAYASRADRCRTEVFTERQGNASRCLRCRTIWSIPVWIECHGLHWPQTPAWYLQESKISDRSHWEMASPAHSMWHDIETSSRTKRSQPRWLCQSSTPGHSKTWERSRSIRQLRLQERSSKVDDAKRSSQRDTEKLYDEKASQTGQRTKDLTDYVRFKDELSVSSGVILRNHRLIINFPSFWGITELHPIARPMSLLLKSSQAERCESASLNDPFYTLIPLHPYIPQWCRMTRSANRRWSTLQTRNVTPSLSTSSLVIMYWSNNPRPISGNPRSTPNPTSSCRRRAAWSQPKVSHTALSATHRTSGAPQSMCLFLKKRKRKKIVWIPSRSRSSKHTVHQQPLSGSQASATPRFRRSTATATPGPVAATSADHITNPTPAAQRPVRVRKAPERLCCE